MVNPRRDVKNPKTGETMAWARVLDPPEGWVWVDEEEEPAAVEEETPATPEQADEAVEEE